MSIVSSKRLTELFCFALLLLNGCATQVLLHPDTARRAAARRPVVPETFGDHPEIVTVTNQNQCRLTGWAFISNTNHGVVLVGDGNATGIAQTYEYNRFLMKKGVNVVVLSYQGFDSNEGKADIHSLYGDVETFYQFCRKRFPNQPIALMAESISTAPFFCFSSRHPEVSALVVEAMVDPKQVAIAKLNDWWLFYPFYPLTICAAWAVREEVPDDLDVRRALKCSSAVPALFIHHPEDKITPYRIARRIYEDYAGPRQWITLIKSDSREGHMTGLHDLEINERVFDFLKSNLR